MVLRYLHVTSYLFNRGCEGDRGRDLEKNQEKPFCQSIARVAVVYKGGGDRPTDREGGGNHAG